MYNSICMLFKKLYQLVLS